MGRPMTEPSHPAKSRSELPGLKQTRSNPPTYRQTRRIIHAKAAIRLGVIFFPAAFIRFRLGCMLWHNLILLLRYFL